MLNINLKAIPIHYKHLQRACIMNKQIETTTSLNKNDNINNINKKVSNTTMDTSEVTNYESFDDMHLSDNLYRGIYAYGFEKPSKIQQTAIIPMKEGRDIIAQSQSGTGKTGAFVIGSLSRVDEKINAPQVIVLSPTRELAQQTCSVVTAIGQYMNIKTLSATGGNQVRADIQALKNGAQYIVGTPGRVYDLIRRGMLCLDNIRYVILDEADQLLEDLFQEQLKFILKFNFPNSARLALFSATMSPAVIDVAETFLDKPVKILIPAENVTLDGISQYCVYLDKEEWKYDVLMDLYQHFSINQAIIYVNTRHNAEWLANRMKESSFTIECIHGEMDVNERRKRMDDFRRGSARVLISTDLLARGIDVQQISIVVNFEMPYQHENYIHRIGRSGRYGRKGLAINLISQNEMKIKSEIEKYYSTRIEELPSRVEDLMKIVQS